MRFINTLFVLAGAFTGIHADSNAWALGGCGAIVDNNNTFFILQKTGPEKCITPAEHLQNGEDDVRPFTAGWIVRGCTCKFYLNLKSRCFNDNNLFVEQTGPTSGDLLQHNGEGPISYVCLDSKIHG